MNKILWHSNAPWAATGYGQQTGLFASRLGEHFDTRVVAFYGLEGAPLSWNGVPVLPGEGQNFGNQYIAAHVENFFGTNPRDGLVISLTDVWILDVNIWREFNVAAWTPVDHLPVPPLVQKFFRETGAVPLAMSKFAMEQLEEFSPLYVPHGIDTNVYHPHDQAEVREKIGIPEDAFVVGFVGANKGSAPARKCIPEILQAFARFQKDHDDAIIFLHTEAMGRFDGVNVAAMVDALDIPVDAIRIADQYRMRFNPLPPTMMAELFSSFDVLANTSMGEGFGIPIVEAQACGTPVIVTPFTAMDELCGSGWKVDYEKVWSQQLAWFAKPQVEDIQNAFEQAYKQPPAIREKTRAKAREFALQYDVDKVFKEHMLPALAEVQLRLEEEDSEIEVVTA